MNPEILSCALGEIDLKYVDEAANYHRARVRRGRSIIRIAAVAIAAALLLGLGTLGLASSIYGRSMTDLLGMLWRRDTGENMADGQREVIHTLSQDIGLSKTVNGITVTVTSAYASGYSLQLLLRVEGMSFEQDERYTFAYSWVELSPEPEMDGVGQAGTNVVYQGADGDGAGLFTVNYTNSAKPEAGETLSVSLMLGDMLRGSYGSYNEIAPGVWDFNFELRFDVDSAVIRLPDTTVRAYGSKSENYTSVTLQELELTATSVSFAYNGGESGAQPVGEIYAVLSGGETVSAHSGTANRDDAGAWSFSAQWTYPIDLNDVVSLRIGDTEISIE